MSAPVVLVLSGPNLNLLGTREPEVYGSATLADYVDAVTRSAGSHGFAIEHVQSNLEAEVVDAVHGAIGRVAGIIINPGAFTHYAWAIDDALAAFTGPVIELHISNPARREAWRHTSVITPVATGTITGFGIVGYQLALDAMASLVGRAMTASGNGSARALPALADLDALAPMEITGRADRLRAALDGAGCDAVLVTTLVNIRYLTGFTGSAARLLVTPGELLFVTDGRYRDQAADQLAAAGVAARIEVSNTAQREIVAGAAARLARVGLEAESVTWADQRRYDADWFPAAEVVATEGLVDALRRVKDAGEVARIEAAAVIADHALAEIRHRLGERPTEQEVALELDTAIRRLGAEGNSFETIVGSGPNGAKPHARPGTRRIDDGDLVVVDFGALVDGYCSDMTRTIQVGEPSATQVRMYETVLASQQAGVDAVAAGAAVSDIDGACRAVIDDAGWGDAFLHATGHGVGLEIHEWPRVAATGDATLAPGHVVTVEPGVYLPEHGGVRIEDTVVVTADGCRALTHTAKSAAV